VETFLTYQQAAERLGCSAKTVRRRVKSGELAAHKLGRKFVRIAERDLAAYLAASRTGRVGEAA
jgi:excisionase family DNA binding protein